MPSDNLEKYFKEKIEAVQHTPPPGSNWNPEATWLKMQPPPVYAQKKKTSWLPYAAAVLLFAILSGLARYYWPAAQLVKDPVVATVPEKKTMPAAVSKATSANPIANREANNTSPAIKVGSVKAQIAQSKNPKHPATPVALPVALPKVKPSAEKAPANLATASPEVLVGAPAAHSVTDPATLPATTTQPVKITIVLGGATSAKMLNLAANENLPDKKKKGVFG